MAFTLRRFDDPAAFDAAARDFLLAHEAENNLIIGLLNALMLTGEYGEQPPYLALIEDADGAPVVAVMRTPPRNLLVSFTLLNEADAEAAFAPVADDAFALYGPTVPGVQAEARIAGRLADLWAARTGQTTRLAIALRIYRLTTVIPPPRPVAGAMRLARATPDDIALIAEWQFGFQMDAFGHGDREESRRYAERIASSPAHVRGAAFWEIDGAPVAMAGYMGPTPNSFRVGAVYTPPEHRRNGYAGALVAAISTHILAMGRSMATLFTDLSNPTSNHIYQEVGYVPVCDVDEYHFDP
jgi:hypothetical protein